jgi:hypothetical protein
MMRRIPWFFLGVATLYLMIALAATLQSQIAQSKPSGVIVSSFVGTFGTIKSADTTVVLGATANTKWFITLTDDPAGTYVKAVAGTDQLIVVSDVNETGLTYNAMRIR